MGILCPVLLSMVTLKSAQSGLTDRISRTQISCGEGFGESVGTNTELQARGFLVPGTHHSGFSFQKTSL